MVAFSTTAFTRDTLARAAAVNSEFTAVKAALATIPVAGVINEGRITYAASAGAANAYTCTLLVTLTAYTAGLTILLDVAAGASNTGASTLNVDSIGVKSIVRADGAATAANDIRAGQIVQMTYDGTNFVLVGVHGSDVTVGGTVTTPVSVANGGTGVAALTDGGILLGSGANAVTVMAVLADSEMIVGDGTTDPVAESGATLRTSIGVGIGDTLSINKVNVGHSTSVSVGDVTSSSQIIGTSTNTSALALHRSSTDTAGTFIIGGKSRGSSFATHDAVQDDDQLLTSTAVGADGAHTQTGSVRLLFEVDGTVSSDQIPGRFVIETANVSGTFVERVRIDSAGRVLINETDNANMTNGLTINQGAADNQILALKSSDVATVLTTGTLFQDVETDDFFTISKEAATTGGAVIQIIGQSGNTVPGFIETYGGAPPVTDTSTSRGAMNIYAAEHDGSNGLNTMTEDSNLLAVGEINSSSARVTRFIIKSGAPATGTLHVADVTVAVLDDHDDLVLSRSYTDWRTKSQLWTDYWDMRVKTNYAQLVELGIIGEVDEEDWNAGVRPLKSIDRHLHLLDGLAWQSGTQQRILVDLMEERDPGFHAEYRKRLDHAGMGHVGLLN